VNSRDLVIVVEDDLEIRESLVEILQESGHQTLGIKNGQEALLTLRRLEEKPRLILLDLMMPIMDGLTFRREQLADPALADIPTVLISAHTNVRESCAELRFTDHLRKPIDLDQLLALTAHYCPLA
jgi:CheY-like chemotaxis protein